MDKINFSELSTNPKYNTVTDFTINGVCSNCGECCTRFLRMSSGEKKNILRYLKKNDITLSLTKMPFNLNTTIYNICPFRDLTDKKCLIYPVRPEVCKSFICNNPKEVERTNIVFAKKYPIVDMFDIVDEVCEK